MLYDSGSNERKYNVFCDFLYYNWLRLSIPQGWLERISNTENTGTTNAEQIWCIKVKLEKKFADIRKMQCSQIYWAEIKTISHRPTSYCYICVCVWLGSFVNTSSGEGIVELYAAPNPFLLSKICLNQVAVDGVTKVFINSRIFCCIDIV